MNFNTMENLHLNEHHEFGEKWFLHKRQTKWNNLTFTFSAIWNTESPIFTRQKFIKRDKSKSYIGYRIYLNFNAFIFNRFFYLIFTETIHPQVIVGKNNAKFILEG